MGATFFRAQSRTRSSYAEMQQRLKETPDKERSLGHSKHHFSKRPEWTRSQEISYNSN
jgi:hypothetical protein